MEVQTTHAPYRVANAVLSAVKTGVSTYGTKSVTTVGHSLGAALSLLDAIFLPLHISGLTVTYYGYGLPRVRTVITFLQLRRGLILSLLRRSETKPSPTTSTANSLANSHASLTTRIRYPFFLGDSWVSDILLAKLTSTMERSGSGVLARTTPVLSVVLEMLPASSTLISATTSAHTTGSKLVADKLFLIPKDSFYLNTARPGVAII